VATRCVFQAENAPKPFSAGALPWTPLGELTTEEQSARLIVCAINF